MSLSPCQPSRKVTHVGRKANQREGQPFTLKVASQKGQTFTLKVASCNQHENHDTTTLRICPLKYHSKHMAAHTKRVGALARQAVQGECLQCYLTLGGAPFPQQVGSCVLPPHVSSSLSQQLRGWPCRCATGASTAEGRPLALRLQGSHLLAPQVLSVAWF